MKILTFIAMIYLPASLVAVSNFLLPLYWDNEESFPLLTQLP